jgi:hypothetical protein
VTCWGLGSHGETGPPAGTFTQIVAGESHMCALRSDGTAACWAHADVLPARRCSSRGISGGSADHMAPDKRRSRRELLIGASAR